MAADGLWGEFYAWLLFRRGFLLQNFGQLIIRQPLLGVWPQNFQPSSPTIFSIFVTSLAQTFQNRNSPFFSFGTVDQIGTLVLFKFSLDQLLHVLLIQLIDSPCDVHHLFGRDIIVATTLCTVRL